MNQKSLKWTVVGHITKSTIYESGGFIGQKLDSLEIKNWTPGLMLDTGLILMRMPYLAEDRPLKSFTLNLAHLNESSLK